MSVINIYENSSYTLDKRYINEFKQFLDDNKDLPMILQGETIIFDNYTIGSIRIKDLIINIQPRISKLSSNHYLEMQLYNEGLLSDKISSLLGENESFGIQENLIDLFLQEAFVLVNHGVEGDFVKVKEETNQIRGKILVNQISPINLFQDKIPIEYEVHTLNTPYNKIIKLAMDKVRILTRKGKHIKLHALVNSYFDEIDVDITDLTLLLQQKEDKIHFENEKYPIVLGLAEKILKDLKMNLKSNQVTSSSYLVNSNNLFEKYVRKVLSKHIKLNVTKWDKAKKMGKFKVGTDEYIKSYSPDIMIDYHNDTNSAFAVLDAKNKDISNHNKIGELSDLYQLLFYCYALNSSYGGLIYPSYGSLQPIRINIDSFKETNLFAFSVDFSKPIKERNTIFVDLIKNTLHLIN
ncbi:McrC family protein [Alkalihalobacterium elongatum]|uniref:McrC family protein n=1 Tax=Alkalihalobacterium elongatum TaxID=2675466 RepID=UPI001C1F8860|nr:McrC family protein [Alkalihalobacterium elongatum]